jgi:ubiquinone/menaquinone biosynthesis C-methylase UbiE
MNEERAPIDNREAYNDDAVVANAFYTSTELSGCERAVFDRFVLPGMDVLDLGVGAGRTTRYLAGLGGRYVGVDYAPAMLEKARQLHPGIEFVDGDAQNLGAYGDASFDAVVFSYNGIDCLWPLRARRRCVAECRRVLRSGGIFITSSHNPRALVLPLRDPSRHTRLGGLFARGGKALVRAAEMVRRKPFWTGMGYAPDRERIPYLWLFFATPRHVAQELETAGFTHVATLGSGYPDRPSAWPDLASQWFEPSYYYVARS